MGTRPVDRIAPGRVAGRPGPLVARPDLDLPHGYGEDDRADPDRSGRGRRSGRVGRFVHRYGWRAYAVPLLTVATLLTLGDLATSTSPNSVAATTAPTTAAEAPLAPAEGEAVPDTAAELDAGPSDAPQPVGTETYVEKGAGTVSVVDVTSGVSGSGPLRRFAVEIENGSKPRAIAASATLNEKDAPP